LKSEQLHWTKLQGKKVEKLEQAAEEGVAKPFFCTNYD
jgi:hypothetical protein